MSIRNLKNGSIIVFFILVFILSGCAGPRNFLNEAKYMVDELDTDEIEIEVNNVYINKKNTFVVSGSLRLLTASRSYPGHVDIAIINPGEGAQEQISIKNFPAFALWNRTWDSTFEALFSTVPPEGSLIRVGYHKEPFENKRQFDCGANIAK